MLTQFTPPVPILTNNKSSDSHYAGHMVTFKNEMGMIPANVG